MVEIQPEPRMAMIIRTSAWLGIAAHAGFIPLFWLTGYPALAAFNLVSVPTWVGAWLLNRRRHSTLAMWLLTGEVVAHAALAVAILGWGSGFQYYLIPLIPFMMFNDRAPIATVTLASAAVLVIFALLARLAPTGGPLPATLEAFKYANMVIPFSMLALQSYHFRLASTAVEARMTEMALTDPLTGLFNRRQMSQRLQDEVVRFRKHGSDFSVIIADVDHFKDINDRYGHDAGVATFSRTESLEACLKQADDALYRGKAEGRNRVVSAHAELN
jgi:predicted signal transduction protein with EAL and GGDEF domain